MRKDLEMTNLLDVAKRLVRLSKQFHAQAQQADNNHHANESQAYSDASNQIKAEAQYIVDRLKKAV